ncbi:hypothetical protein SAMN06295885_2337 [Rathayibacter oskolensis]|uniref:Uncharacterized protein n=2 Tax=Rathayibacter oskolensis TaxID=1891671 RepID=A0A1X7P0M4_9MICO|nr:hypothetical protein SAMN06295885_2337 [Rathayibacter oskolensis]
MVQDTSSAARGDFSGRIQGHALLLTPSGTLVSSVTEMWFPKNGDHAPGDLSSTFTHFSTDLLASSPWGPRNIGRWKRIPDLRVYGATQSSRRSEFRGGYPAGAWNEDPGRGTSMCVKKYTETRATLWPRYFGDYYG